MEDQVNKLLKASWRFRDTYEFKQFFDFIARFDHYSGYNIMLVHTQNPSITFFGSISYWENKFKRHVIKDARPHVILAPKGPVVLVYDVFDTVGKDSPEDFLNKGLGRKPLEAEGKLSEKVKSHAYAEVAKWGIKLVVKPMSYYQGGYAKNFFDEVLEIGLKKGMSDEAHFAVLMHELAHLFLGHTAFKTLDYGKKKNPHILPVRRLTRTARELEAETVSHLICSKLGIKSWSVEYIAGYITCEQDLEAFDYEVVIRTADKLEALYNTLCK